MNANDGCGPWLGTIGEEETPFHWGEAKSQQLRLERSRRNGDYWSLGAVERVSREESAQVTEWRCYYLRWYRRRGTSVLNEIIQIQSPDTDPLGKLPQYSLSGSSSSDPTEIHPVERKPLLTVLNSLWCSLGCLLAIQVKKGCHVWDRCCWSSGGESRVRLALSRV